MGACYAKGNNPAKAPLAKAQNVINRMLNEFCNPGKPHVFRCRDNSFEHCGKGKAGAGTTTMVTVCPRWRSCEGKPTYVCTDNLNNPPDISIHDMIHEMLRQWFDGGTNQGWDNMLGPGSKVSRCMAECKKKTQCE